MEFRILGPVEVWSGGRRHDIARAQERCVLAILLMRPGQPVSANQLLDYIWDGAPPLRARDNLYIAISRLRQQLSPLDGNVSIDTLRSRGYVLRVDEQEVDLFRFRMRRRQARAIAESGDDPQALDLLQEGIQLYRGEPLTGLSGDWAERNRRYLEDQLFDARVERVEIKVRMGQHADLVTELSEMIVERPGDQRLVAHLMMAFYRSGRQADALVAYVDAQRRLRRLYGTDPEPELRELYDRILHRDRTLLPVPRAQPPEVIQRNGLPDDIRHFTGREEEIALLRAMAASPRPEPGANSTVVAIDGMPGVGKTVLAVHLAYQLAGDYPDGQIYLDLHGLDAGAALDRLLQGLGVPAQGVPRSVEDRAALWRSELVSRRVLLLLDNASGHEQIRPLLSGAPGCLTLVTSRRRLVGLDDIRSVSLAPLPPADASELLGQAIGPGRSASADELAEVVRLCGFLPLAIQLVGNRMRHRPARTFPALIKRLGARRLAEIRAEDREVTAAFEVSYRSLDARVGEAFRRLGLHLGADLTVHTAAAAIGCEVADADHAIEELLDYHLLLEPVEGRYRFHGLLRDYARQLAETEDSAAERDDAVRRQIEYYVSTALLADRLLYPRGRRPDFNLVSPPDPAPIETADHAREWLRTEYQNLLVVADQATAPDHVALLAYALARYLEVEGHWDTAGGLHQRAVTAWRELDHLAGEARALSDLCLVCFRTGRYDDALRHARDALEIYRSVGDERGTAEVLDQRALVEWQQCRYRDAVTTSREALTIWRSLGDRHGEARVLDHGAIVLEFLGRYQEAVNRRGAALEIYAKLDDPNGLQMSLNNQGDLMLRLGRVSEARVLYENAAAVFPEMARQHDAIWRNNMARIQQYTGRYAEALDGFRYALATYRTIGDRRNEIETLIEIGTTYDRMGKREEALIHYEQAYVGARRISEFFEQTKALRRIGEVYLGDGRLVEALEYLQQAVDLADRTGEPYERAKALEGIGHVFLRTRGRHPARRCWKQVLRFYERAGMASEAAHVRTLLDAPRGDGS